MKMTCSKVNLGVANMGLNRKYLLCSALLGAAIFDGAFANNNHVLPNEIIDQYYRRIENKLRYDSLNEIDKEIGVIVQELFDVDRLAPQVLQNQWSKSNSSVQARFVEALKKSLQHKIVAEAQALQPQTSLKLTLESSDVKDKFATLHYSIASDRVKKNFTIFMLKYPDENWKISNVKSGNESLLQYYFSLGKKEIDRYSLAQLIAVLRDDEFVVLEDFEGEAVGQLPTGWNWRRQDDSKNKPYTIGVESGNQFLAAEDNGESVILGKNIKWDLKEYPYISFKWRARHLPTGGDERFGHTVDSAAGIYVIYKEKLGLIPESIKYVWSTTLPVGSAMRRSGTGRPWMVVAECGDAHLDEWRTYVFNLKEAYEKTFGGSPPDVPVGIAILSDANSTHSKAYADYDDIRALKYAGADSGIKNFLNAE
jgi:hypothetical protein